MPQAECSAIINGLLTDPITFLSQNIVYINMDQEGPPTRSLRRFEAVAQDGQACIGANGNAGGGAVYSVYEDPDGGILAHYLPWNMDAGYYIVLNRSSPFRLMFTAALSGCAVGVVWGDDGSARVSHHNIQGAGGSTDDAAQQRSLVFTHAALHRGRYRELGPLREQVADRVAIHGHAHVHGVRRGGGPWRFYVQVMRRYAGVHTGENRFVIADVGELRP